MALFFRLKNISEPDQILLEEITKLRNGQGIQIEIDPASFRQIPGSPFAYWSSQRARSVFTELELFETKTRFARRGPSTGDDFRRVRLWWEINPLSFGRNKRWVTFAKGGAFSPYYADISLVVDWDKNRNTFRDFFGRPGRMTEKPESVDYFFRKGLTWSRRTQGGLSFRILPSESIFADKGPSIFVEDDDEDKLRKLLGVTNSSTFKYLVDLQMTFGSYEVGVIQKTPLPNLDNPESQMIERFSIEIAKLKQEIDSFNEISHVFRLPALLIGFAPSIKIRLQTLIPEFSSSENNIAVKERNIDHICSDIYNLTDEDDAILITRNLLITNEITEKSSDTNISINEDINNEENTLKSSYDIDSSALVTELVSYCVGAVFGRWDLRYATGERPAPELPDPFAALPAYSPGMLRPEDVSGYPYPFSRDGILPDDEDNQSDLVISLRNVLELVFGARSRLFEEEILEYLGVKTLRDYFRKTGEGGFWQDHIQRYSGSRRKAPIYWLLQSPKGRYALWLYYPRLSGDTLATALRDYVEPKLRREQERLAVLRADAQGLTGRELREVERQVERQEELLNDIQDFRERLERVVRRGLKPDHNDGVLLTIAPLWELVPWPEAKRAWTELQEGKYEWSSISRQLRGLPFEEPEAPPDPGEQPVAAEPREERSVLGRLRLRNLGPAEELDLQLDPRINIMTGDNGLGKTFVLDAAWQVLTGVEPPEPLRMPPSDDILLRPDMFYELVTTAGKVLESGTLFYDHSNYIWMPAADSIALASGIQPRPGLVLYIQSDGKIAIWDRIKRVLLQQNGFPAALIFDQQSLWRGMNLVSQGLINDIRAWWQAADKAALPGVQLTPEEQRQANLFNVLNQLLERLSPDYRPNDADSNRADREIFRISGLVRLSSIDTTLYPTITMPYGDVPIIHASVGVHRALSIAYTLVWGYEEHRVAAERTGQTISQQMVVLIDEVEMHLHPKWQRRIVPALLDAIEHLLGDQLQVQFLITTHAPLILASLEPRFNEQLDQLFVFDRVGRRVQLNRTDWAAQGDVTNWLVSDVFDLSQGRSFEAERAIEAAKALMRGEDMANYPEADLRTKEQIHAELLRVLPGMDPFWPRWVVKTGLLDTLS